MEKINVLWTGGLDSTYLIVKLCRVEGRNIQPYYILDNERKSVIEELKAIKNITERIRNDSSFPSKPNDIIIKNKSDIRLDDEITNSWKELHAKFGLGVQYDFIARFSKQMGNIKFMIGALCFDNGRVSRSI